MKKKCARKPKDYKYPDGTQVTQIDPLKEYPIEIMLGLTISCIKISTAKRLHTWLGQAINYLEQKRNKK